MFLKSLSVRGFKSFADRTILEFTPGVAVIVGPNGSGKSNLVDAIAWVLGEQGAKTLRGGKMEDVIFAGTPKRPSLGRAEVELTIDNSSGMLPIEFTEVTIRRTLFRSGESEYAINDVPCRLLDVQELLSDSGIGRELHTIVGQGQLDAILSGRPEDRRSAIEEAAGILKHRKRKERAIRKLERVDQDIERLGDVIGELRRQIRPLERQAELAKRAAEIETELREVRLKIWVLDYRALVSAHDAEDERRAAAEVARLTAVLEDAESAISTLESQAADAAREGASDLEVEYRMSSLAERFQALALFAQERARHLDDVAAREPRDDAPTQAELAAARQAAEDAAAARASAETEAERAEAEWRSVASAREEAARAREQIVHLTGERAALRAAVEVALEERRRLSEQREALSGGRGTREDEVRKARSEIEDVDAQETGIVERMERFERERDEARALAEERETQAREAERAIASLETRRSMLVEEAERGAGEHLDLEGQAGILGLIRDLVTPRPGFERAVRAALEPLADALLATSRGDAIAAVERLKAGGRRASFVVLGEGATLGAAAPLPAGTRSVLDVASVHGVSAEFVREHLARIALASSLAEAADLARSAEGIVVVTTDGDRVGPDLVAGGAAEAARDPRAEARAIEQTLRERETALASLRREREEAIVGRDAAEREVRALAQALDELDARLNGAAERLARLEREEHAADREDAVLSGRLGELSERLAADQARLRSVEEQLGRAVEEQPSVDLAMLAQIERRAAERSLRLGEAAERERTLAARLAEMQARVARAEQERARWEAGLRGWRAGAERAREAAASAAAIAGRVAGWAEQAGEQRTKRERERGEIGERLVRTRLERRETSEALEEARRLVHETDLRRAERSHRISAAVQRLRDEADLAPEEALEAVTVAPEDAEDLRRRATGLERRLALMGRVNPIAMEQYQGMVDRHAFLTGQVDDLKGSRRDLMSVVDEVDRKIVEVFGAAFADVEREFADTFARLFPGGEGRVVLTDPANVLESGVDIEARPAGKRVKRVSLLSGGERSLVSVAYLYAIFRARPSPFYLLDEVEPALDDINLHRFLEVTREFKSRSQILIVTHQKRTMEIADSMYGISMSGDGVTRVICEKLGDPASVDA